MWCRLFFLFLVGAVSGEHFQAWKTGMQYDYQVRSRTLTALHDLSNRYTGIIVRALLTIRPTNADTLEAKMSEAKYAQIHTKLPDGWESRISDDMLDLQKLPMSENVFEIKMRHGVVRDLMIDKDVPTWEINVLKSIVSQLQVDTQGENMISSGINQEPTRGSVNAMYKTMEDSVGGKCEVLYDINNVPDCVRRSAPDLLPKPELRGKGGVIEIIKNKNFCNCEERIDYHFDTSESHNWDLCADGNGKFLSKSASSRIIVTGDLRTFTIQSSVTTHKVILSPNLHENKKGMVSSRVNLTLVSMGPLTSGPWSPRKNLESVGNLVYSYDNPFAGAGENRQSYRPRSIPKSLNSDEEWDARNSDNGHVIDHDGFTASRSSSNENLFERNDEQLYWQSTPNLNVPPHTPLLPFFLKARGISINGSDKLDPVTASKSLVTEIGHDLENPNNITDEQTLEKFIILARLIRTMSTQQIAEAQREIDRSTNATDSHGENESIRRNSESVFRDAVAQAGTGPALLTIKKWIKNREITGVEAASVVGVLSKTARSPTPEYVDAFFKIVTMPEVTSEEFLNSTAMIAFAELIRYSQLNHDTVHYRHTENSFGHSSPKHNPAIFRDYIPYMADQLKKSIENKEFSKSHVFIRALGNVAHPRILSIFEPYLEGDIPASTFQRLLMVFSMNHLASLRPRLARGVFYRIYHNTAETHQLRSAAVTFLMPTNPPAIMLQRIAEFTNYDHSRSVNAAVKRAIESASKLTTPESQDLANKARNVLSLLNKEHYDNMESINYFSDYAASEWNLAYRTHAYVASDNFIVLALYASLEAKYGDFEVPKSEIGALLSSLKHVYDAWSEVFKTDSDDDTKKVRNNAFDPANIAKLLTMKRENNDNLEGAFWINSKYNNKFMSLDKNSFRSIPELVRKASASLREGANFNVAKIESYDMTLSFPMESGFPFVYTTKVPVMMKLSGSIKVEEPSHSVNASIDLRLVCSMQIQGRLGFVTPFEHQHYVAGVNKNLQAYVPIRAEVKYDKYEKRITMKLQPIEQNEKIGIAHYSLVPFTSRHSILDMSPVMKGKETRRLINGKVWHRSTRARNVNFGMEADSSSSSGGSMDRSNWDPIARLIFALAEDNPEYAKADISLEPDESGEQSVILDASLHLILNDTTTYDENRSKASPNATAPTINSKQRYDPERTNELMKEAAKGISEADTYAIDLGVEIPGNEPSQILVTVAYANSPVDEKSRGLGYFRLIDPPWQMELESCVGLESVLPRMYTIRSQDRIFFKDPDKFRSFDVDFRVGTTCDTGFKTLIHGDQEQTEQYGKGVRDLQVLSECMKDVRAGAKFTSACRIAGDKIYTMDKSRMTIRFDPKINDFREEIPKYFAIIENVIPGIKSSPTGRTADEESIGDNALQLSMNVDLFNNVANLSCESSEQRLTAEGFTIPFGLPIMNLHPDLSDANERLIMNLTDMNSLHSTCEFKSNEATTFDNATYPFELGKCWHVAAITYPKFNNGIMGKIMNDLSILVRDTEGNSKDVRIVLGGGDEVDFTLVDSKISVTLNGKTVDMSKKDNTEGIDFDILQKPDGSIELSYPRYEVDVLYDGHRVQIKVSEEYRNAIRGLCGNYDGESANDFVSPRDCPMPKFEDFVGSFAMTSNDCEGPAIENSRKATDVLCEHKSTRLGNVVTDREAGRPQIKDSSWGFHDRTYSDAGNGQEFGKGKRCTTMRTKVIEEKDQTCFSLRPMPTCSPGCKAIRTKSKIVPVYCMLKGTRAEKMAERIEQGANPDLSQKSPSKKSSFGIPVHCHAGAASLEIIPAWKTDTEYQYRVGITNFVAPPRDSNDTTDMKFMSIRALLTIRPQTENTLHARISKAEYGQINDARPHFWELNNSDRILEFEFPMSEEVFIIKTSSGVVTDLIVNSGIPTWNVNVLKSIVGNLQVSMPGSHQTSSMYKTMEDSVGGKCEVIYDIKSRSAYDHNIKPELGLDHKVHDEAEIIEMRKTKDYCNCEQRPSYNFGSGESLNKWEQCTNGKPNFLSRSSSSDIIVIGDVKAFTIRLVNTEHTVKLSPTLQENEKGLVQSRSGLILKKITDVSSDFWVMPPNLRSVGSLVYSSNDRFAETGEDRLTDRSEVRSDADVEYCDDNKHDKECRFPTPNLGQVPFTPPLPLFDTHGRKLIHRVDDNDRSAMYSSIGHATWISKDLENPDVIPDENTFEKFTILVDIIRTMNTREIGGARRFIFETAADPDETKERIHYRSWPVLREAVAQAGTGSALLAIRNWIIEKTIEGMEAASVVGVLSTTARTLSAEYMDDFFEMITMPEIIDEEFLNSTAIITFAELIRLSLVNENSAGNNNTILFTSGRGPLEKNPAIFRDYIPYMSEQLKKSIDSNEFARSHVFIRALGNVGHPAILAIFEPYLQGVLPASTFQRLLMVFSMDKLASTRPRHVRRILYDIYRNTDEADQIRCAAVVFLMTTNPPACMLQRMAEFTNDDRSKFVNAAVKEAIKSASKLATPEHQDLATKARNVLGMLTKESYDEVDLVNDFRELNSVFRIHNYVAADSFIEPAFYSSFQAKYGDLNVTKETGGIVATLQELYNACNKYFRSQRNDSVENNGTFQFSPDIIAELLKIESRDEKMEIEGVFWTKSEYNNKFISFDKRSLRRIPELLTKATASLKEGRNFSVTSIESNDLTLSFPMESGFPFIYTMKAPAMLHLSGSVKGENDPDFVNGSIDLSLVYSTQIQGRLGFVTPFDHQHYMAGVNRNYHASAPIRARFNYQKIDKPTTLKLELVQNRTSKLLHYSVVPFTSRDSILSVMPISTGVETTKVINSAIQHREVRAGSISLKMEDDTDLQPWTADAAQNWNVLQRALRRVTTTYTKSEVFLSPTSLDDPSIVVTTSFETYHDDTTEYDKDRSESSSRAKAPKINSTKLNDPKRRNALLMEAVEGIAAADGFAYDIGIEVAAAEIVVTGAYGNSKIDEKSRLLLYAGFSIPEMRWQMENCLGFEATSRKSSKDEFMNLSRDFDIDVRVGETCENGSNVQIHGSQDQTEEHRDVLYQLPSVFECIVNTKFGIDSRYACRNISKPTSMDKTRLTMKFDQGTRSARQKISNLTATFVLSQNGTFTFVNDESVRDNILKFSLDLAPSGDSARFTFESADFGSVLDNVEVGPSIFLVTFNRNTAGSSLNSNENSIYEHTCLLYHQNVRTFDRSIYGIDFGDCWHVVMTTYPRTYNNSGNIEKIDEDMKLSVLVRVGGEYDGIVSKDMRFVRFVLGSNEVQFVISMTKIFVLSNKKLIRLNDKPRYRHENGEDLEFELIQRNDSSVLLSSPKYEIDAFIDTTRVQIGISDNYANKIRGLCGNYDFEADNDFTSPKGCVLTKPEEFAGSYALTSRDCRGRALENAKKAEAAICLRKSGRIRNEKGWRYFDETDSGDEC